MAAAFGDQVGVAGCPAHAVSGTAEFGCGKFDCLPPQLAQLAAQHDVHHDDPDGLQMDLSVGHLGYGMKSTRLCGGPHGQHKDGLSAAVVLLDLRLSSKPLVPTY